MNLYQIYYHYKNDLSKKSNSLVNAETEEKAIKRFRRVSNLQYNNNLIFDSAVKVRGNKFFKKIKR